MTYCDIQLDDEDRTVESKIRDAYREFGYRSGWTFMMCPRECLSGAKVLLVGLNPGGGPVPGATNCNGGYEEAWDCREGNSYWHSDWGKGEGKEPLQQQVQKLMGAINVQDSKLFAALLVPFRSQNWASLERKNDALNFSRGLWRWVFAQNPSFDLIFTLGHDAGIEMAKLFDDVQKPEWRPCGWGKETIGRYNAGARTIISLPHLSRYKIFGRSGQPAEIVLSDLLQGVREVKRDA